MPAVKKYTRINFQNYPSTSTPLNATNLNKMDKGIDDLDDEVVSVKNTIENMSFDADAISYDNTQSGLQATDVQGAVDEINDNLSGFKFYPTGTGIVGLIADDSAYTNEDGNYIVWGTATANQLVADNPNTYRSVPSEEDTRGEVGSDLALGFGGTTMNRFEIPYLKLWGSSSHGLINLNFDVRNMNTLNIYRLVIADGASYFKVRDLDNDAYIYQKTNVTDVYNQTINLNGINNIRFEIDGETASRPTEVFNIIFSK